MKRKIVHASSLHPRFSIRIFLKQCRSLRTDYHVSYVVADGRGDEFIEGVQIYDVGKPHDRIHRLALTVPRIFKKALEIDSDLYHLHDPELLLIAKRLQKYRKKVIFDAHEDLPKQIYTKPYLKTWMKKPISMLAKNIEKILCRNIDAIVTATPAIRAKFLKINNTTTGINNYPVLSELYNENVSLADKNRSVCYVGGISRERGILYLVKAFSLLKEKSIRLHLIGRYTDELTHKEAMAMEGYKLINEHGFQGRGTVKKRLQESMAGIVTLLPFPNYIESQPIKMFEYMSAGIPVIASNFPLWKKVIEGNQCGICVNPESPEEIANAIEYIVNHPIEARRMGRNGRRAIELKYNWEAESKKLLNLYKHILHSPQS